MEEKPINPFCAFKEKLKQLGINVDALPPTQAYTEIKSEDITIFDIAKGNLDITREGIFNVNQQTGERQRVFLYKRRYYMNKFGKPRFHICKCQTLERFMNSKGEIPEYRKSNTEPVSVINVFSVKIGKEYIEKEEEKEVTGLPLCKYCEKLVENRYKNTSSTTFVEILKKTLQAPTPSKKKIEVDVNGNVKNWHRISTDYLRKHDFTCENCNIKISPLDSDFIQVYHKDKDKTNNKVSNLICLCVECHSKERAILNNEMNRCLMKFFKNKYKATT